MKIESIADWATQPAEAAQSSLEYLLVIGALVAAMLAVMVLGVPPVLQQVAGFVCPSVDTAVASSPGSCVGP